MQNHTMHSSTFNTYSISLGKYSQNFVKIFGTHKQGACSTTIRIETWRRLDFFSSIFGIFTLHKFIFVWINGWTIQTNSILLVDNTAFNRQQKMNTSITKRERDNVEPLNVYIYTWSLQLLTWMLYTMCYKATTLATNRLWEAHKLSFISFTFRLFSFPFPFQSLLSIIIIIILYALLRCQDLNVIFLNIG